MRLIQFLFQMLGLEEILRTYLESTVYIDVVHDTAPITISPYGSLGKTLNISHAVFARISKNGSSASETSIKT